MDFGRAIPREAHLLGANCSGLRSLLGDRPL